MVRAGSRPARGSPDVTLPARILPGSSFVQVLDELGRLNGLDDCRRGRWVQHPVCDYSSDRTGKVVGCWRGVSRAAPRGLSREAFADVVGVHRTYMGGLERG